MRNDDGKALFADRVFSVEISRAIKLALEAYRAANYRDAIKFGFFELQNARDHYRDSTIVHGTMGMCKVIMDRFVKVQLLLLTPITPHFCDHIWQNVLGMSGSILNEKYPQIVEIDETILAANKYLHDVAHSIRSSLQAELNPRKKKTLEPSGPIIPPNAVEIYVATLKPRTFHQMTRLWPPLNRPCQMQGRRAIGGKGSCSFRTPSTLIYSHLVPSHLEIE